MPLPSFASPGPATVQPFRWMPLLTLLLVTTLVACDSGSADPGTSTPPSDTPPIEEAVFDPGDYPMSVESENEGPLYRRARSDLTVSVPFVATDSLILVSDSVETVGPTISVVPTTDNIELSAYELLPDGSRRFLQTRTLPVTDIPPPDLGVLFGGRSVDKIRGIDPGDLTAAQTVAYPNPSFASTHGNDAVYSASTVEVTAYRGSTPLLSRSYTSDILDLSDFRSVVQPDDVLIVEILEVRRRNADGNIFVVPVSSLERVIVLRVT
ncbi:MAG: hypothetical protein GVY25_05430 [Bacteroidetes bacterium]|jgi:hypothetical protein|nr:hypothetical protein [Bacteroidota bacterium]